MHQALISLPEDDQARLGVLADWKTGPHRLTYRQAEYTFGLVAGALGKDEPGRAAVRPHCSASAMTCWRHRSRRSSRTPAARWRWTGRTWSPSPARPPAKGGPCADPEASWGHRKNNLLRSEDELFYGYYLSAGTMAREETGADVPELARRMTLSSCCRDPVRAFAPVLTAMPAHGIPLGDILDDSGYSHRDAAAWAIPLRAAGAALVQDLHPHDRGPKGTHHGAIIANGNLYCPCTPRTLLELGPLARTATSQQAADRERTTAELARHKLGRLTADDADGYHRVQCPAATGKIRCPLRPASMTLDRDRPEILQPPEHPQACCTQQTITVPPDVNAKTAQKHDYPSAAWRRSYARRTGAERGFATAKDPATNDRQPRLVPPHGPDTPDAVHRDLAHRPQPAHPGSLDRPAGTNPAPRSRRAAPQNPPTAPQDPRRPRRRTALTAPPADHEPRARHPQHNSHDQAKARLTRDKPGTRPCRGTRRSRTGPRAARRPNVRPKRENRPH